MPWSAPPPSTPLAQLPPAGFSHDISSTEMLGTAIDPCGLLERLFLVTSASGMAASVFVHAIPEPDTGDKTIVLIAAPVALPYAWARASTLRSDPWLQYARTHSAPATGEDIKLVSSAAGERCGMALVASEFASCYVVPVHSANRTGRHSVLLLGSAQPDFFKSTAASAARDTAHTMAVTLHKWWVDKTHDEVLKGFRLRAADVQLLRWERDGLSTKAIARLLGCSPSAVDSKFQRLILKLGTTSRKRAVQRATVYELM